VVGLDPPCPTVRRPHLEGRPVDEPGVAAHDLPAVLGSEIHVLVGLHVGHQIRFARDQLGERDLVRAGVDSGEPLGCQRHVPRLGGGQQCLGGHAAGVHARAADRAALDHHHRQILPSCGDRGRERPNPRNR
jgi:hypothetical protein